jgi:hypothetical protein
MAVLVVVLIAFVIVVLFRDFAFHGTNAAGCAGDMGCVIFAFIAISVAAVIFSGC